MQFAARVSEPYWHRKSEDGRYSFDADAPFGLPFRPTEFYGEVTLGFPGVAGGPAAEEVFGTVPVQYRYSVSLPKLLDALQGSGVDS